MICLMKDARTRGNHQFSHQIFGHKIYPNLPIKPRFSAPSASVFTRDHTRDHTCDHTRDHMRDHTRVYMRVYTRIHAYEARIRT